MKEQNKENNEFNKENCFNKDDNYNERNCFYEKKVIMYLIIIALLLFYCSLFFIHNIRFIDNKKNKELLDMEYDDREEQNNNTIGNNITNNNEGNNKIDNIFNNIINSNNNIIDSIISGNATNNNSGDGLSNNSNTNTSNPEEDKNNSGENINHPGETPNKPGENTNNPGETPNKPGEDENNPGGNTSNPGESTSIPDEEIVNNKDRFKVTQESKDWNEIKSLNIFNNSYFNGNSIIAPNVYGKYNFTVENYKDAKIMYNFRFSETNVYNINMVYKLKKNGLYIAGDEHTFVRYKDLNVENILIDKHKKDIFTLEWKWQDSDNDTQIGKTHGANYKLNIEVNASEPNK